MVYYIMLWFHVMFSDVILVATMTEFSAVPIVDLLLGTQGQLVSFMCHAFQQHKNCKAQKYIQLPCNDWCTKSWLTINKIQSLSFLITNPTCYQFNHNKFYIVTYVDVYIWIRSEWRNTVCQKTKHNTFPLTDGIIICETVFDWQIFFIIE